MATLLTRTKPQVLQIGAVFVISNFNEYVVWLNIISQSKLKQDYHLKQRKQALNGIAIQIHRLIRRRM